MESGTSMRVGGKECYTRGEKRYALKLATHHQPNKPPHKTHTNANIRTETNENGRPTTDFFDISRTTETIDDRTVRSSILVDKSYNFTIM